MQRSDSGTGKRRRAASSFTLIELVVAMGLFSVIILIMLTLLDSAQKALSLSLQRSRMLPVLIMSMPVAFLTAVPLFVSGSIAELLLMLAGLLATVGLALFCVSAYAKMTLIHTSKRIVFILGNNEKIEIRK